ncbi:MAG: DUF1573 domain-containing protein, partial [Gemmataceae bacterium]|nr:DUF1573 domain-containing protein [Gemmataceae bacterium]
AFAFVNEGKAAVTIKKVRTSCSCSAGKLERDRILPGEKGEVVLEVDARGQAAGPKSYSATVEYDAEPRQTQLVLVVHYEPDVLVVPSELSLTLMAGKSASARFRMIDTRPEPFVPARAEASASFLGIEALPQEKGTAGRGRHEYEVTVRDGDGLPFGKSQATVAVHAKDGTAWTLPVAVEKLHRVRFAPSSVWLKRRPDGSAEARVLVSDTEDEAVVIESATAREVEAVFAKEPRPRQLVTLRAKSADTLRFPLTLKLAVVRPCRQEAEIVIAGLSSSPASP